MACQAALHPRVGIVAGPRRQEDCRSRSGAKAEPALVLWRNQPSGWQARVRVVGEGELTAISFVFPRKTQSHVGLARDDVFANRNGNPNLVSVCV